MRVRSLAVILPSLGLLACGPKVDDSGTDGGSTTAGATSGATADASTSPTTGDMADEMFGFACVELLQAESEEEDPFVGTAEIAVTLRYESCLAQYYTQKHPEQRLDGPEGLATFEAWRGRLCSEPVIDPLVPCTIAGLDSFTQTLIDAGAESLFEMKIVYQVQDASAIKGGTLLWGPGPLEEFAECAPDERPFVFLALPGDIVGFAADGTPLWQLLSYSNPRGVMQRNTAGCVQVEVARNN